jgi:hypothetical protein
MSKSGKHVGVLTEVQEVQNTRGVFKKAWIKGADNTLVFFHQNSLLNVAEINELADGQFILFDTKVKKTERGDRLDAINCTVAKPTPLLYFLLDSDNYTIGFVREHATSTLLLTLHNEAAQLDTNILEAQQRTNLADVTTKLAQRSIANSKPVQPELPGIATTNQPASVGEASRFLHNMFAANSPEYNRQLFTLLAAGIKSICDEDSFTNACFLLEFNDQLKEGHLTNLRSSFYELASSAYRFRLWLEGVVPYCDTTVLMTEFANGNDTIRNSILSRCPVDYLDLLHNTTKSSKPAAQVEAHFSQIKAAILAQLSLAKTSIQVAVAWFTHDELFGLLCSKLEQAVEVDLVINNDYINNWEYGLPFQEFVDKGGRLYLSEYPSMMHHKFCLVDEELLLTGSYNWTYYAESRNEENILLIKDDAACIDAFKVEFARLKTRLGAPVQVVTRFPATELPRFERLGFREYLSKDIESRVTYVRAHKPNADVQALAQWLDKAVEIDEQNTTAKDLQKLLAPAVTLERRVIQSQRTVQSVLATIPAENTTAALSLVPSDIAQSSATKKGVQASPPVTVAATVPAPATMATSVPKQVSPATPAVTESQALSPPSTAKPTPTAAVPRISTGAPSTTPGRAVTPVVVDTKASIPERQKKRHSFDNVQLVFALDYSNSMEANAGNGRPGYKLYSTNKVQKVIDMIFAISKGLTASESIDMFLFEQKAIQLPAVTEINYHTYVQDEILQKYAMNGTNISAPIEAIHTKYTTGKGAETNVFVIFITDGENNDVADNQKIKKYFKDHSQLPIFWQFVGLGNDFSFLKEVDKTASNAAFFSLNDVNEVAEEELSIRVLQSFPQWFKQAHEQGIAR